VWHIPSTACTPRPRPSHPQLTHTATDSIGGAAAGAAHLPAGATDTLTAAAHGAFTDAIGVALLIGTGVMLAAAVLVKRYLPDLRSSTATPPGVGDEKAAPASPSAHKAPALEAQGSPN